MSGELAIIFKKFPVVLGRPHSFRLNARRYIPKYIYLFQEVLQVHTRPMLAFNYPNYPAFTMLSNGPNYGNFTHLKILSFLRIELPCFLKKS